MADRYVDQSLSLENNINSSIYYDSNAVVLAIKNILLTKPGNYEEMPSFGMNIMKYQFQILDDETISEIQSDLSQQINKYIPIVSSHEISIVKFTKENGDPYDGIGISVSAMVGDTNNTYNFVVIQNEQTINCAVDIV